MKKRLIAALLSVGLVFSLAACGTKPTNEKKDSGKEGTKTEAKKKDGGTVILSSATDPTSLNPFFRYNRITYTVSNALFDPLFREHDGKKDYCLAKDLKVSEDMLTYTLTLKDNLKWHDGQKITSDDIVYTVKTLLDKNQNIEARGNFVINNKDVQVAKKDDLTVEFKLPQVYVPFEAALGDFRPIPKHIFEKEKSIEKAEASTAKPVGSGPFKFKEWKKGEMLTFERFNDYHGGKPNLDKLVFRISADTNSTSAAFENGEITTTYLTDENYLKYSKDQKFNTYTFDEGMVNYIVFNMKNPLLAKKEVRQAISYALNKDELLKADSGTTELTKKASSVMPPSTKFYTEDVEKYDHNIEKAKELMKKAGVSKGKLKFMYTTSKETSKKIVLVVQEQLKAIGIDVEAVGIDDQSFFAKLMGEKERDYDLIMNGYVMGDEPSAYGEVYSSKASFNASQYLNKDLDKLFDDAKIEKNEAKRKEMYEKIQKTIAEDAPVYTLDYSISKVATDKKLGGVKEAKLVPIYMFEDLSKLYFTE
ncbi:ABC transporter substrate-binding protein [Hathewaya histolytica]|uniref:ABC transporter substrate-binding protein n=1 Tax=Hathewaya histolytica TaxID=1498 RepID=UPI003B67D1ED